MKITSALLFCCLVLVAFSTVPDNPEVGYRVASVTSYKNLRTFGKSGLYEVVTDKLDDGRPIKLLELYGNHY